MNDYAGLIKNGVASRSVMPGTWNVAFLSSSAGELTAQRDPIFQPRLGTGAKGDSTESAPSTDLCAGESYDTDSPELMGQPRIDCSDLAFLHSCILAS